ncbi:DNA helicase RecQ [Ruminococcus bromii]|uniref:DNA helicase RecQ n=1 Tax=Ruminococcus bromii TaxID=40518 RepID=UPI00241FC3CB|nr:DNA helicase RecQ [Ruminococcus bromii]
MSDKLSVLKDYFGHDSFRDGQEQIVDALLDGRDALCIMPTGAGKSMCYQIPALLFDGVTIVVSPLISLMKDQVGSLVQSGVPAAYINSSLSYPQFLRVLSNTEHGKYKIIYVAPERLLTDGFLDTCKKIKISMVAVDEAHCVSQWGQDFRPSYLKIVSFIKSLENRPIVGAFTATATNDVKEDIKKILRLENPFEITTGFDRPNLFFGVIKSSSKDEKLIDLIRERGDRSGIVYCATRKNVESVCELLCDNGFSATRYHAGLDEYERRKNQEDFVFDRKNIMVATNAFGMGIDKSNVTYVIHYNMPKNIESYYQEAGRAGRDGGEADCILLYSPKDVRLNRFMIENSEGNDELTIEENEQIRERDFERLKHMTFYSTTNDCLRGFILRYFGGDKKAYCGKCSNCLSVHKLVDVTIDAQKIMSCIARTGQRYGKTVICDVLKGSKSEKILKAELNNQSTYGIMKEVTARHIFGTIDFLAEKEYISSDNETEALKLLPKSRDVLFGRERLVMKKVENSEKVVKTHRPEVPVNSELLDALKALRKSIASKKSVPAYVIFSDATLIDMCKKCPETPDEMLEVSGVGRTKLEKFGKEFLEVIAKFR